MKSRTLTSFLPILLGTLLPVTGCTMDLANASPGMVSGKGETAETKCEDGEPPELQSELDSFPFMRDEDPSSLAILKHVNQMKKGELESLLGCLIAAAIWSYPDESFTDLDQLARIPNLKDGAFGALAREAGLDEENRPQVFKGIAFSPTEAEATLTYVNGADDLESLWLGGQPIQRDTLDSIVAGTPFDTIESLATTDNVGRETLEALRLRASLRAHPDLVAAYGFLAETDRVIRPKETFVTSHEHEIADSTEDLVITLYASIPEESTVRMTVTAPDAVRIDIPVSPSSLTHRLINPDEVHVHLQGDEWQLTIEVPAEGTAPVYLHAWQVHMDDGNGPKVELP